MPEYVPIYEDKQGNKFTVLFKHQIAPDEITAGEIGIGTVFVEGILFDFRYTGETLELGDQLLHVKAGLRTTFGELPIALVGGPVFERKIAEEAGEEVN